MGKVRFLKLDFRDWLLGCTLLIEFELLEEGTFRYDDGRKFVHYSWNYQSQKDEQFQKEVKCFEEIVLQQKVNCIWKSMELSFSDAENYDL